MLHPLATIDGASLTVTTPQSGSPSEARHGTFALYVRKAGVVTGPFARGWLERLRDLGRLQPEDDLSPDGERWLPAAEMLSESEPHSTAPPAGANQGAESVDWELERRRARLRWIDERSGRDRRDAPFAEGSVEARSGSDRRMTPAFGFGHGWSAVTAQGTDGLSRRQSIAIVLGLVIVIVALGLGLWMFAPTLALQIRLLG